MTNSKPYCTCTSVPCVCNPTPPRAEWEKRFDDRFPNKIAEVIDDFGASTKNDLKYFISRLLSSTIAQERERKFAYLQDGDVIKTQDGLEFSVHIIRRPQAIKNP